jgi:hypothetical protein
VILVSVVDRAARERRDLALDRFLKHGRGVDRMTRAGRQGEPAQHAALGAVHMTPCGKSRRMLSGMTDARRP